jgi:hypothetical protein
MATVGRDMASDNRNGFEITAAIIKQSSEPRTVSKLGSRRMRTLLEIGVITDLVAC